eukprot:761363-Hanusia_phi.AAC.8
MSRREKQRARSELRVRERVEGGWRAEGQEVQGESESEPGSPQAAPIKRSRGLGRFLAGPCLLLSLKRSDIDPGIRHPRLQPLWTSSRSSDPAPGRTGRGYSGCSLPREEPWRVTRKGRMRVSPTTL